MEYAFPSLEHLCISTVSGPLGPTGLWYGHSLSFYSSLPRLLHLRRLALAGTVLQHTEIQLLADLRTLRDIYAHGMLPTSQICSQHCFWERLRIFKPTSLKGLLFLPLKPGTKLEICDNSGHFWKLGAAITPRGVTAVASSMTQAATALSRCELNPLQGDFTLSWDELPIEAAGPTVSVILAFFGALRLPLTAKEFPQKLHLVLHNWRVEAEDVQAIVDALPAGAYSLSFSCCEVSILAWRRMGEVLSSSDVYFRGSTAVYTEDIISFASFSVRGHTVHLQAESEQDAWVVEDSVADARRALPLVIPVLADRRRQMGVPPVTILFDAHNWNQGE